MADPQAVTLDLFGTLVDLDIWRDEPPLVERLLGGADTSLDAEAVLATWVEASLADRARTPFRTVRQALEAGAREVAREHALSIEPARWTRELEALWMDRPLHDDVHPVLDRLDEQAVPWAIVTNLDRHVLAGVLERTGIGKRARVAVTSEHARAYKPHPRPFRLALDQLGVVAEDAVHVGDSPGEDRAGARAAGMRCVLVDREADRGLSWAVDRVLG